MRRAVVKTMDGTEYHFVELSEEFSGPRRGFHLRFPSDAYFRRDALPVAAYVVPGTPPAPSPLTCWSFPDLEAFVHRVEGTLSWADGKMPL